MHFSSIHPFFLNQVMGGVNKLHEKMKIFSIKISYKIRFTHLGCLSCTGRDFLQLGEGDAQEVKPDPL